MGRSDHLGFILFPTSIWLQAGETGEQVNHCYINILVTQPLLEKFPIRMLSIYITHLRTSPECSACELDVKQRCVPHHGVSAEDLQNVIEQLQTISPVIVRSVSHTRQRPA